MLIYVKPSLLGDKNRRSDTRKIQKLLNAVFPSAVLLVDGICDRKTIIKIERLQRRFMNMPDGQVDPGRRTLRRLIAAAPAVTDDWKGNSSNWSQEKKILSLHRFMRGKVERTIDTFADQGFRPKIVCLAFLRCAAGTG
jgi:hypothetical protein